MDKQGEWRDFFYPILSFYILFAIWAPFLWAVSLTSGSWHRAPVFSFVLVAVMFLLAISSSLLIDKIARHKSAKTRKWERLQEFAEREAEYGPHHWTWKQDD